MDENNPDAAPVVQTVQHEFTGDDSLSYTLVRAVSAVTGDDPRTIDPLYASVDPDALDTLVRSARNERPSTLAITFFYHGCYVTVRESGTVRIRPCAGAIEQSHSGWD